ncbi:unnamed protein product [Caenorhabditis angaria]|uniref:Uncharacterized protein n=1 Tax=Caenorhabditis angaria TaxID=860376 RepID=A0A9P1MZW7_9PELO|nr:unnamed protein product [Caenorhabditis angaria]
MDNLKHQISTIQSSMDMSYQLEKSFIEFLKKREGIIPIDQFGEQWIWKNFAEIYKVHPKIDIFSAFLAFLMRIFYQPIGVDIKVQLIQFFKIRVDFMMKEWIEIYHDIELELDDNLIVGWRHKEKQLAQAQIEIENLKSELSETRGKERTNAAIIETQKKEIEFLRKMLEKQ